METVMVSVIELDPILQRSIEIEEEYKNILDKRYKSSIGKKVIELGLGTGMLMQFLNYKFGEKVFRMELADWNTRNNKINNGLVRGEMMCLPIASSSVDVVVSLCQFEDEFNLRRAIEELERILIEGGETFLVISGKHLENGKLSTKTKLELLESRMIPAKGQNEAFHIVTLKKVTK